MSKTTVLVLGATGSTGKSVVNGLLASPDYHVIAVTRSSSLENPIISSFKSRGAEIRTVDLSTATPSQLDTLLTGVEIVISTLVWNSLGLQYQLIDAAKRVGTVKRVVPSDWSPPCVKGVRKMHDEKLAIHEYVINSGLGYTFIDAAYWFTLPPLESTAPSTPNPRQLPLLFFGKGETKYTTIHLNDIGLFVPHILLDTRTLNNYIYIYAEQVTQLTAINLARRFSGNPKSIPDPLVVSETEVRELIKTTDGFDFAIWEYVLSVWFRGDTSIENVKKEEYGSALDARELYPNVRVKSLEEFAREFYGVGVA